MSRQRLEQMKSDGLGLTPEERTELVQFLQSLGKSLKPTKAPVYKTKGGRLYLQVTKELESRHIHIKTPPLEMAPKLAAKFDAAAESLEYSLKRSIPKVDPSEVEKLLNQYFRLFASIVITWIENIPNVPVNIRTIVNAAPKFPSLLDRSFPGYGNSPGILLILNTSAP